MHILGSKSNLNQSYKNTFIPEISAEMTVVIIFMSTINKNLNNDKNEMLT